MNGFCLEFMAKIVVFDSGLGSLSIIKAIQSISKVDIIYFADQQNFPYGNKSQTQLGSIIKKSIKTLQTQFTPDVIVMASNTPSLIEVWHDCSFRNLVLMDCVHLDRLWIKFS